MTQIRPPPPFPGTTGTRPNGCVKRSRPLPPFALGFEADIPPCLPFVPPERISSLGLLQSGLLVRFFPFGHRQPCTLTSRLPTGLLRSSTSTEPLLLWYSPPRPLRRSVIVSPPFFPSPHPISRYSLSCSPWTYELAAFNILAHLGYCPRPREL